MAKSSPSFTVKAWAWWLDYAWVFWRHTRLFFSSRRFRRVPSSYLLGEKTPVALLPGVYETWQFLKPIADRLNAAGHPIHVVRSLGYNVRDIPLSARTVASFLVEHDLRHVVVVAHSKGGLIGKYLMTIGDVEGRVDRLVAINTPFSGSAYARFDPHIPVGSELAGAHNVLLPIMGHFRPLGHRLLIDAVISAVDGDEGSPHDPIRGLQE